MNKDSRVVLVYRGETFRYKQPKIGRNDLCPCGSGKKYKHCCLLRKEQTRDRLLNEARYKKENSNETKKDN
jgi:hypothetical protein